MTDIFVGIGELKFANSPQVLVATGLGSCVAVCVYDADQKHGMMAHVALPEDHHHQEEAQILPGKYATTAIPEIVAQLTAKGSTVDELQAKIVGGSAMFASFKTDSFAIGQQNVEAVKQALKSAGIRLIAEDTAGTVGRSVKFFLYSGEIEVKKRM